MGPLALCDDFAITNPHVSGRFRHSNVIQQDGLVRLSRQPRTHTLTIRKRHRLPHSFLTRPEQVLVGTRGGVQDVDVPPFARLVSDNDVAVGWGSVGTHK